MRVWVLCVMVLLLSMPAWADVTAEVLAYELDQNGNILVWTSYAIDGVDVPSRYPKQQGRSVYATRYSVHNFAGMTPTDIQQRVLADVTEYSEVLVKRAYTMQANQDLISTQFDQIIGSVATVTTATILVDTNGNDLPDREWTVATDGTRTERDVPEVVHTPTL